MTIIKDKNERTVHLQIGSDVPKQWNETEISRLKEFANKNANRRSEEQKIKNKLMALRFEIEANLNNNRSKPLTIDYVLKNYLIILNLPFRKFAICLDSTDSNLKKYVAGERKFNKDLALKFSNFFHTPAELWLKIQHKNELYALKESKELKEYKKYDYRKALEIID